MDQLISSGYTNFNLTYMNEYGEGIIGFDQARESFTASLTLDNDMVLYDHDLNGSNISAFLTLHNIKPEGKIEKFNHFMNYYAIYNSPKLNKHNIHHYLNVTVDRTVMTADNVDKYLVKGKKYNNIRIEFYRSDITLKDIDADNIAFISSFAQEHLVIVNEYFVPLKFIGPMFEHCNVKELSLTGIALDEAGCSSINVETLKLTSGRISNPYLTSCKCKHLHIYDDNTVTFPPLPYTIESLDIRLSNIGTMIIAYLPFLQKAYVDRVSVVVLYELHDLQYINIDAVKMYIQEDVGNGISVLSYHGENDKYAVGLLKAMPNITRYETRKYTDADSKVSQQLEYLNTSYLETDNLPQNLETLGVARNADIAVILRANPNIKKIIVTRRIPDNVIEEFPNVEFSHLTISNDEYIKKHNRRTRNKNATLTE